MNEIESLEKHFDRLGEHGFVDLVLELRKTLKKVKDAVDKKQYESALRHVTTITNVLINFNKTTFIPTGALEDMYSTWGKIDRVTDWIIEQRAGEMSKEVVRNIWGY